MRDAKGRIQGRVLKVHAIKAGEIDAKANEAKAGKHDSEAEEMRRAPIRPLRGKF